MGAFGRRGLMAALLILTPWVCRGQGFVTTVAGNGARAYFGENIEATAAGLGGPNGLGVDSAGNIYIADNGSRIRKVDTDGIIRTVAGSTVPAPNLGFSGDGGPATSAAMLGTDVHQGIAVDAAGNIYIADILNHRIRKVDTNGIINTVAGSGQVVGGGAGQATAVALFNPHAVAVDAAGSFYIADTSNSRIRKVDPAGNATVIAGTGAIGFSGDGGLATAAQLNQPRSVTVDRAGNVYFSDFGNIRIRKVDAAGVITTVAGTGSVGFSGDGGPATSAPLTSPLGVAVDASGNLYIADSGNDRIRKVDPAGIITTIAGNGNPVGGFTDGGPALSTTLFSPRDVAVAANGDIYFADFGNNRIRKISATPPSVSVTGNVTSLSFSAASAGAASPMQRVNLGSSAAALTFATSVATSSGGGWLSVTPANGTTPTAMNVSVSSTGLAPGAYDGTVTVTPDGVQNVALKVAVTLTVAGAPGAPAISAGGVVNGASFAAFPTPVTAGAIVAIFGVGLAPSTANATAVPLPTDLAGTQVLMNGLPAPLFFVSSAQINAQVPWELRGNSTINVRVTANGAPSNTEVVQFAGGSPGVFTLPGTSAGILTHGADGTLVTAASPAARGEVLVLYATGLGKVTNTPASGAASPSGPLAVNTGLTTVTFGFQPATIYFAGLSPGFVGLYQINLQVPQAAPVGDEVAVQVLAGGGLSNNVTVAVR